MKTMKAVVLDKITEAKNIILSDFPVPEVKPGRVLIKVKAFGMNHSEQILRLNEIEADYIKKPIIPGIECVGEIADSSDTDFKTGQKVIALMGGMGRSFNGSYAEYVLAPARNVFEVQSNLSWEQLAAIPETFFTAWGSLFECLQLTPEDTLLIRGATCALGYASIQIAKALGCKVIATTHREDKLPLISNADMQIVDNGVLKDKVHGVTKALELVGPKSVRDTLALMEKGGIVCNTGILGGVFTLNGFDPIKDIPNRVYLAGFFSNYPSKQVIEDMFQFLNEKKIVPMIGKTFDFANIREAVIAQDTGKVNGKIIIKVSDKMTQNQKLLYLINYLKKESTEYERLEIPTDKESRFMLYRSLVNVRPALKVDTEFLETENSFLKELISEKGITDIAYLKPIENNIYLWKGDITTLKCGAIVNAANSGMTGCYQPCHSCIDNCIHTFAGVRLRYKCNQIMTAQGFEEPTGKAKITPAYNLPCNYVIHTVGPIVSGRLTEEHCELLTSSYRSCLELAVQNDIKSIAFCCISTGVFGFPKKEAAKIAVTTIRNFQKENNIEVIFNVFKEDDYEIYKGLLGGNTKVKSGN